VHIARRLTGKIPSMRITKLTKSPAPSDGTILVTRIFYLEGGWLRVCLFKNKKMYLHMAR